MSRRGKKKEGAGPLGPRRSAPVVARWAAVLIALAGGVAYSNSLEGIFVFDDEPALVHNPHLGLSPLSDALRAPEDTTLSGRPVATLSFALDHDRSGGTLSAYHATNFLIHVVAALLLFEITRRTLTAPIIAPRFSGSAVSLSLVTALVFVVHPLQTGSVTYIVQRVESLMGALYLATLYCAIRALEVSPRRPFWTAAAILCCGLGMGSKEVMVTAPLMVMLWDRQFAPDRVPERKPLYAALAATWLILAGLAAGGPRTLSVGFSFPEWPWWRYLMTQAEVVAHYLRLAFVPTPLVLDYGWPAAASVTQVLWPGALVSSLVLATLFGLAKNWPAAFLGAWFFLILAPTSSVLPIVTEVAAEHRMYLPLAAVIAFVVLGLFETGRRLKETLPKDRHRFLPAAAWLVSTIVIVAFVRMTYERNLDYQDYDRIWSDTIAKRPQNPRARNNYATSLLTKGRFAEAERHLRVAVELDPKSPEAQANLGVALSAQGRYDEGSRHLESAIALRPGFAEAHRNLGEAYALQHRMADAAGEYAKALDSIHDDVMLLNRAAWILSTAKDPRARDGVRARGYAEHAVGLTARQDPVSLDSLAASLAELGEFETATEVAREALERARARGDAALSRDLEARAALYARGERFREP